MFVLPSPSSCNFFSFLPIPRSIMAPKRHGLTSSGRKCLGYLLLISKHWAHKSRLEMFDFLILTTKTSALFNSLCHRTKTHVSFFTHEERSRNYEIKNIFNKLADSFVNRCCVVFRSDPVCIFLFESRFQAFEAITQVHISSQVTSICMRN